MGTPLSYAAGGAASGLEELLKQRFFEQIQKMKLAEDQRQANLAHAIQQQQLGQGDQRLGLDREKFGEDRRQFDVGAGQRERNLKLDETEQPLKLRLMGAQAGDIERKPLVEKEQREFTTGRDAKQHQYQMGEIGAQGANALRVANVRHPDATGPTTQQENEVEDAIRLIDQIGKDPSLSHAVGPVDQYAGGLINVDPTGVNRFKALHGQLVGKMSLAQAGKLKGQGQISDKERAMLAAAATALSRGLSEQDYKAELAKVRGQFERMRVGAGPAAAAAPAAVEYDFVPGKGLVPRKGGGQ